MDDKDETASVELEDDPIGHQFAKTMFGSVVAFGANKLADRVFDAAVRAYRARKSS